MIDDRSQASLADVRSSVSWTLDTLFTLHGSYALQIRSSDQRTSRNHIEERKEGRVVQKGTKAPNVQSRDSMPARNYWSWELGFLHRSTKYYCPRSKRMNSHRALFSVTILLIEHLRARIQCSYELQSPKWFELVVASHVTLTSHQHCRKGARSMRPSGFDYSY